MWTARRPCASLRRAAGHPFPARGRRLSSWRPVSVPPSAIALFMDIGQGAGTAGASGVRPFLPALLAGALARGDSGIDFDGTDYSFLESEWFLLAILFLAVAAYALSRRRQPLLLERVTAVIGLVLGGLLFAGSLADGDETSWWGLIAGVLCAALGYLAIATLFARARSRLSGSHGAGGAEALTDGYAEAIALALAALAIFVEPVGYAALLLFAFLIIR